MSDTEIQPSALGPATMTHHRELAVADSEPLYHAHPAPETKQTAMSERKRKEAPETTSHETTVVTKTLKVEGSGSRGRVRTADFSDLTRSIIEESISIYRAQIASVEPFPERTEDRDTVKQAWLEVCRGRNLRVGLDEDIFKLVSHYSHVLLFATMISCCRLLRVLLKQEDMPKRHLGLTSYLHSRLTVMGPNGRFVTVSNSYWKVPTLFIR